MWRRRRCPEIFRASDGKWRCGYEVGHAGAHQGRRRGQWFAVFWGTDADIDRKFGIG